MSTPSATCQPEISVVIPVLNGSKTISEQIIALLSQETDESFEVVIVDDGSTDGTQTIVKHFAEVDRRIRFIDGIGLKQGGSAAKNRGVIESRAEKIAFCDADDRVDLGWLKAMSNALDTNVLVVCRRELHSLNPPHIRRILPEFSVKLGGGTFGISRSLYLQLGMFNEDLAGAVDTEFFQRATRQGVAVGQAFDAVVSVRVPRTAREVFQRQRRLKASYGAIRKIHGLPNQPRLLLFKQLAVLIANSPSILTKSGRYKLFSVIGAVIGAVEGRRKYGH